MLNTRITFNVRSVNMDYAVTWEANPQTWTMSTWEHTYRAQSVEPILRTSWNYSPWFDTCRCLHRTLECGLCAVHTVPCSRIEQHWIDWWSESRWICRWILSVDFHGLWTSNTNGTICTKYFVNCRTRAWHDHCEPLRCSVDLHVQLKNKEMYKKNCTF